MKKTILSLFVAVGLVGSASAETPTGDLTNGLVAFYSGGNTLDQSGNGNNLTGYNVTTSNGIGGEANSCFYFNGINSYLLASNIPNSPSLAFTWSAWVLPSSDTTNSVVIDMYSGTGGNAPILGLNECLDEYASPINNTILFADYAYGLGGDVLRSDINSYKNNVWNQIVVTANAEGTTTLYVNGTVNKVINFPQIREYDNNLSLGAMGGTARFFKGGMTDVGIWNTALTSSQVFELYTTQLVPEPSTYALFGIGSIGMLMVMRRKKTA